MKYDKYTILFLSSWYPNRIFPFQGDFVKRHAKAVSLFSNVICLHVAIDASLRSRYIIKENEENNLKEIIIYFNKKWFRKLFYIFYYYKGFLYLKNKYGRPDLIHGNVLYPKGIIMFLLSFFYKVPYIFTEHWTGFQNGTFAQFPDFKKRLYSFIAKKAKRIIPVTDNLKQSMIELGIIGNYTIIPNVVETEIFKINQEKPGQKKHILHVSNIRDQHKNISGMLRVVSKLSVIRQDFVLDIIHSEENKSLRQLADSLNLTRNYVNFLGKKEYDEVAQYMSKSAFLVLFSNYENLPCVIVEAFASGLPVLSTDVGGISEHLDEKKGILIKKGDEIDLLDKMNYMLDHYNEYDKSLLHEYAVTNFSYEKIGLEFYKRYQEILDA